MARRYGLIDRGGNWHAYRDPTMPHCTVMIRDVTKSMRDRRKIVAHATMYGMGAPWLAATCGRQQGKSMLGNVMAERAEQMAQMLAPSHQRTFEVWIACKRSPKIHTVTGDLLDAAALAAEIIHQPPASRR